MRLSKLRVVLASSGCLALAACDPRALLGGASEPSTPAPATASPAVADSPEVARISAAPEPASPKNAAIAVPPGETPAPASPIEPAARTAAALPPFAALVATLTHELELDGDASARAWASYRAADHVEARRYFAWLAHHEPSVWKHAHNLACSSAKSGALVDARVALEESVRRGGEAALAKAKREPDFAALRGTAWFDALMSGGAVAPLPATPYEERLSASATAIATSAVPPSSPSVGLHPIPGAFDPFVELLRRTTKVSLGKRTAYGPRRPPKDAVASTSPAWTPKRGRKHLAAPSWWQVDADHTYLVVPYDLAGYDSTFGSGVRIHGYALYVVDAAGAHFVHGLEHDPRGESCGDADEVRELFFDAAATMLFETHGCQGPGVRDGVIACAVRSIDGELVRSCSARPSFAR